MEIAHLNLNRIMCKSNKLHLMMYAIYVFITLATVSSIGFNMFNKPELPYLIISTYPSVRQIIPLIVIGAVQMIPLGRVA